MDKKNNIKLCFMVILIAITITGCSVNETENDFQEFDFIQMAYQLEGQIRFSFQNAYNSWLNIERRAENNQQNFQLIKTLFRQHLENSTSEEVIDYYINRLENIKKGGEGEMTFPTHEVLRSAEVIDSDNDIIKVNFLSSRFFPETEWEGAAYSLDFNYDVTLIREDDSWQIAEVVYQEN